MLNASATGVFVIAPTPFTETGAIDPLSTDRMTDAYLAAGATGLTLLGIMGEAPKLEPAEALEFVARVIARVNGRVPVVVGVSSPGFAGMRTLARGAAAAGAAGVMVAPVPGLKGDEAVLGYLQQAMDVCDGMPFVLQDYPQQTGITLTAPMIARLAADPRLVMLKAEDWPGLDKISALRRLEAEGKMPRISIFGGNGGQFLVEEALRGADGMMTGYAFPEMLVRVQALLRAGDTAAARDLFDLHLPLIRYELQPGLGLAVRKHVLVLRGILGCAALRPPGPRLSAETMAEVEALYARVVAKDAGLG